MSKRQSHRACVDAENAEPTRLATRLSGESALDPFTRCYFAHLCVGQESFLLMNRFEDDCQIIGHSAKAAWYLSTEHPTNTKDSFVMRVGTIHVAEFLCFLVPKFSIRNGKEQDLQVEVSITGARFPMLHHAMGNSVVCHALTLMSSIWGNAAAGCCTCALCQAVHACACKAGSLFP